MVVGQSTICPVLATREHMSPDELHIWYVLSDSVTDPELLDGYRTLLTPDEQERCGRFIFEKDRHQCLITRALVRTTLSRYADVDPRRWQFSLNAYGRPEISEPAEQTSLRFNISHTAGLVVCAVVMRRDVGIDVEDVARRTITMEIARRHFATDEMRTLESLPADRRQGAFFDFWTLKEAYIKARGRGMSIPLSEFSFHQDENRTAAIRFAPGFDDDPRQWQFDLRQLNDRHKMAVAVRCDSGRQVQIICRQTVPQVPM